MRRFITAALAAIMLTTFSTFAQDSLEDQVAEYLRRFPYQLTYDYTVRFTGGDARNFNRWIGTGEPALWASRATGRAQAKRARRRDIIAKTAISMFLRAMSSRYPSR